MDYVTCRCGAVLATEPREKPVKYFGEPSAVIRVVDEIESHHCPTFDFGAGAHKETRNDNKRLG